MIKGISTAILLVTLLSILLLFCLALSMGALAQEEAQIAFSSERDGNWEIYVMNADGGNPRNLTNDPSVDYQTAWSPNGKSIMFISSRWGPWNIYVMDAHGNALRRVTAALPGRWNAEQPAWLPDGENIAFSSNLDKKGWKIYVMNADGKNLRKLTERVGICPAWSPDGRKIAFEAWIDGNSDIYVIDANGGNEQQLTNSGNNREPDWFGGFARSVFPAGRCITKWSWLKKDIKL